MQSTSVSNSLDGQRSVSLWHFEREREKEKEGERQEEELEVEWREGKMGGGIVKGG